MDIPVIELAHPMPGFPDDARFALVRLDEEGVLHSFRSLDSDGLQFVVVPPAPFYPDFAPEIGDDVVADLGIDPAAADDVLVLLVVRAGATLAETTVNLRAPLVVNPATRRACQVVLDDAALPLAAPLKR
ncbi:flagellar assembly protein FliW [Nocardioides sp. Root190]|uniref:flagellar assembly protein FliW n=1 Tax=Nocardioides sp. Root190 TaxID=1736488 RepID=UPI001F3C525F|nr:flagellar assembly protein FliW [Nocardioides sp. Root190]